MSRAYKPTRRQERARAVATVLSWDPRRRSVAELLDVIRHAAGGYVQVPTGPATATEPPPTIPMRWVGHRLYADEWRKWEDRPGFLAWWANGLPMSTALTRSDLLRLDAAYWRELAVRVEEGDVAALKLYTAVRALAGEPGKDAEELRREIEAGMGSGWVTDLRPAEA